MRQPRRPIWSLLCCNLSHERTCDTSSSWVRLSCCQSASLPRQQGQCKLSQNRPGVQSFVEQRRTGRAGTPLVLKQCRHSAGGVSPSPSPRQNTRDTTSTMKTGVPSARGGVRDALFRLPLNPIACSNIDCMLVTAETSQRESWLYFLAPVGVSPQRTGNVFGHLTMTLWRGGQCHGRPAAASGTPGSYLYEFRVYVCTNRRSSLDTL